LKALQTSRRYFFSSGVRTYADPSTSVSWNFLHISRSERDVQQIYPSELIFTTIMTAN
jgi:hypothetical protein